MPLNILQPPVIPDTVPEDMALCVEMLKKQKTQKEALEVGFEIVIDRYKTSPVKTFTRAHHLLRVDLGLLWPSGQFLHCTNMQYLLAVLLVKSGHFSPQDIRFKWTMIWYLSPHQYMQVRVDEEWMDVDVWGGHCGLPLGAYAHKFNIDWKMRARGAHIDR